MASAKDILDLVDRTLYCMTRMALHIFRLEQESYVDWYKRSLHASRESWDCLPAAIVAACTTGGAYTGASSESSGHLSVVS